MKTSLARNEDRKLPTMVAPQVLVVRPQYESRASMPWPKWRTCIIPSNKTPKSPFAVPIDACQRQVVAPTVEVVVFREDIRVEVDHAAAQHHDLHPRVPRIERSHNFRFPEVHPQISTVDILHPRPPLSQPEMREMAKNLSSHWRGLRADNWNELTAMVVQVVE